MRDVPFRSPKQRLGRAKHHIRTLERGIKAFFKKNPYVRVVEPHTDGVSQAHKIRLRRKLPDSMTDATYEVAEAMRSALEQAVYAVAVSAGAPRPDLMHFPVTDDPAEFENAVRGRTKGLPPDIVALLNSFQAYPGGNDLIVALNQIRRQGFHRIIMPVGTAIGLARAGRMLIRGGPASATYIPNFKWDSTKDEMVFAIVGPGGELQYQFQFSFIVAFGEVEGLAGQAVVNGLTVIAREVERIVLAIEAETKRLGLIP